MGASDNWVEVTPLGDLLIKNAALHPDRAAVVLPDGRLTFAELLDRARAVTNGLFAIGLRPGDNVGLMAGNNLEFVAALYGISLLGCVIVPLNVRHKPSELSFIIKNSAIVALLTTSDAGDYVDFAALLCNTLPSLESAGDPFRLALTEAPLLRSIVSLRGAEKTGLIGRAEFDRRAQAVDANQVGQLHKRVKVRDVATIIYTSGTTANPKGCMLSHEALTRGPVERARLRFAAGTHDVHWGAGPLFHIGSLAPMIGALGAGCTYVTDTHFDAVRAVQLMVREQVTTIWPWFQAIVQGLLEQPDFNPQQLALLKSIVMIGSRALAETVQSRFPETELLQACGMTETAGIFALAEPSDSLAERATAQGKPYPGLEVRIANLETGLDAAVGELGEILVRGYCVMEGYHKDPAKTAEAIDSDGWLHTGDLYRWTEDGSLIFNGRLKDMLKVGGENVAAIEVETFLCDHPAVRTAAIVGMPDPRLEEVPVAFVELHNGAFLTPQGLIDFCKGKISNYKIPRAVHFVSADDWPMSATKINKRALRDRLFQSH